MQPRTTHRSPSPAVHRPLAALFTCVLAGALIVLPVRAQEGAGAVDRIFSFATAETPGCVVGAAQRGKEVVKRAYGVADVAQRTPLTERTVFDIGSTQKQFVAASVLLLVEEGRLSLSDDIHRYLPELPDYGHRITVDHLLTHTSGIRDWTGLLPMAEEGAEVLPLIVRQRALNFAPGEAWAYSNSGYVLLKEIVARVSGVSFAEFAGRRLFEPLGMTSSAYVEDILHGSGELALAYRKEGAEWMPSMRLGNERGGGTVVSTAADLLRWNEALTVKRLGTFVSAKLEEPARLANGRTLTYARGLNVSEVPGAGRMVAHSGGAAGYSAWLGRFPEHALSVVVLCNFEPVSATSLAGRVADLFLPAADSPAVRAGPVAAPGVDVAARAGLYLGVESGEPLRLVLNNGRLGIAGGMPLVPVSADRFLPQRPSPFFRSEDDFELAFVSSDELVVTSMEGVKTRYRRAQPWAPGPGELAKFAGRYRDADLGPVFEIVPAAGGRLVFRMESSPERALELEPVAHDLYMRSLAYVRFHRDAAGNVTRFEYHNPVARNFNFERIGELSATPAPPAPAVSPAASAPPLEALVGEYRLGPDRSIVITLENGQLYGEPTGNPKRLLVHVSGAAFAVKDAPGGMTASFTLGEDGRATALVLRQNGKERTLPRMR